MLTSLCGFFRAGSQADGLIAIISGCTSMKPIIKKIESPHSIAVSLFSPNTARTEPSGNINIQGTGICGGPLTHRSYAPARADDHETYTGTGCSLCFRRLYLFLPAEVQSSNGVMESANPLAPLFQTVYGPVYFSAVTTTAFYGVTCMQTFFYYVHYQDDSPRMKSFVSQLLNMPGVIMQCSSQVAVLWVLDTIHEALTIAGTYKYVMAGLVNPLAMLYAIPELLLQTLPMFLIAACVQGYFVYRIYLFSGKNVVAPILWAIQAIYQILINAIYVAKAFYSVDGIHDVVYTLLDDGFFRSIATSCLSLAAAVDVLIAFAMTFLLFRKRNETGFASTAHILQRLTMFAVNTGICPAMFAVLSIILLSVFPQASYYVAFATPLSSIYCNTLLANLNARTYIREGRTTHNAGPDLVMTSLPVSGDTEKQSCDAKSVSPTNQNFRRTTEILTFMDAARSNTSEQSAWF
ncbi:hypothetical protein OG21DRAFT_1496551 [Imleria badia]|nr:hypothetical protein OG21DRAFT_1496551 [Imleria badia]